MHRLIKHDRVRVGEAPPASGARPERARPRCAKTVELLRVDGDVRAIELGCSCGERTVIELDFDAEPPAAKAEP